MFARIHHAKFRLDQSLEVVRVAQESLDTFRALPGFHWVTYLYDQASGWGIAVCVWSTQSDAEASEAGFATIGAQVARYRAEHVEGEPNSFDVVGSYWPSRSSLKPDSASETSGGTMSRSCNTMASSRHMLDQQVGAPILYGIYQACSPEEGLRRVLAAQ